MRPISGGTESEAATANERQPWTQFVPRQPFITPGASDCWAVAFWIPLAYAILRYGAVETTVWCICLAGVGIMTLLYHAATPRSEVAPPPTRLLCWALIALPAYALLQIVPVPVGVLAILSPERADIASSLQRIGIPLSSAPLSVVPSETLFHVFRIVGCTLLFLAARNLTWRWPGRTWGLAVPLLFVASAEAVLGLIQFFATPDGFAHGTYVHRNHFAGLLEIALPFAVAYPFAAIARKGSGTPPVGPWLRAGIGIAAAALMLVAISHSLSRSGFGIAFGSLGLMAVAAFVRGRGRARIPIGIAAVAVLGILIVLAPPDRMIERFERSFDSNGNLADIRPQVWSDTGRLISAFPIFGCGLGGFEAAFHQYRTAALAVRIDYAHNDYLQAFAELGLVGSVIVFVLCGALLVECVRAVRYSGHASLALASAGALAAMAAHSLTDFNLHIPANALVVAWVAGVASGLSTTTRKVI